MFELTISSSALESFLIENLAIKLKPYVSDSGGVLICGLFDGRAQLSLAVTSDKKNYIKMIVVSSIADTIVSHYKYKYLYDAIDFVSHDEALKSTLVKTLTEFDKNTDKNLAIKDIVFSDKILLDSLYNFKFNELKVRWSEIAGLVVNNLPNLIAGDCLFDMMKFLISQSPIKTDEIYIICKKNGFELCSSSCDKKILIKNDTNLEKDLINNLITLSPNKIFINKATYSKIKFMKKIESLFEGRVYITK